MSCFLDKYTEMFTIQYGACLKVNQGKNDYSEYLGPKLVIVADGW